MDFDLVLAGGTVVSPWRTSVANVGVVGERIAAVDYAPLRGGRMIDASGKFVIPGVIDPHLHLQPHVQGDAVGGLPPWGDDYGAGTVAAACGGVTCVFDFPVQTREPRASLLGLLEERIADASARAAVDFSFHLALTHASAETLFEVPKIIEMGVPTFKFFLTYPNWKIRVDLGFLYGAMEVLRAHNGMAAVHSEEDQIIEYLKQTFVRDGRSDLACYALVRPDFAEEMAINNVGVLSRETGCRAYIVHVSSKKGLEAGRRAKHDGAPLSLEGVLHYLFFTHEVFALEPRRAAQFVMGPPYRSHEDIAALWDALADGTIDWMGTDHSPYNTAQKTRDMRFYSDPAGTPGGVEYAIPTGIAGVELLLPLMFSEGVNKGRISVERLVDLLCYRPARHLGLRDKGEIRVGADADLVVIDPNLTKVVRNADLHSNVDFSIYEGIEATGWPVWTVARGRVVAESGRFTGSPGWGRFVRRELLPP